LRRRWAIGGRRMYLPTGGNTNCGNGCGTVFELSQTSGVWAEGVLYSFQAGKDGASPIAGVTFGAGSSLFGTTFTGGGTGCGGSGCGTVFELTPSSGSWTEKLLHSFNGKDGWRPDSGVVFDLAGNLYGTTQIGGSGTKCSGGGSVFTGCGPVFELVPGASGWTEHVLHTFSGGPSGLFPTDVVLDPTGNLYGTAGEGVYDAGFVFEVSRSE
jgi:hypothetical protein